MEVCRTGAEHRMAVQRYDMPDTRGSPMPRFWRPVNIPVPGPDGAIRYILHQVDDVTDQMGNDAFQREMTAHLASFNAQLSRNAEERERLLTAVRAEHERTSEVLESIGDIFYAVDERFRFTYVNRRAAEVWRRPARDLIGRSLWEEFPSMVGTESYDRHLDAMAHRAPVHYETVSSVLHRWIDVSIYPSAGGGLAVYFHDIEDRKRAEAERESARAEAESARSALEEAQGALESRVRERTTELARANEALSAALAERERAERDRNELLRKLALAQEEERRRLSRDLHDEVGQHLAALGLGLRALSDVVPSGSEVDRRAAELHALATSLGQELHALAVRLRPRVLDDFGLEAAVASYAYEWTTRHGIPVEVHAASGVERAPAAVESAVYRIAQEALTNVAKHSGATRASIVLERRDGHLHVIVEDDGRGFDADASIDSEHRRQGLGLLGIRERAAMLGGTVQVESAPDAGTTIFVRLPIEAVDDDDRHRASSDTRDA
jgi:PAS domain S-box-containing protein